MQRSLRPSIGVSCLALVLALAAPTVCAQEYGERAYLGVRFKPGATPTIVEVVRKGPAALAGLKPGDVILRLGTIATKDTRALTGVLAGLRPGSKVKVLVQRGKSEKLLDVTLGRLPRRGMKGLPAPAWAVDAWFQLPKGKKELKLADLEGKIVYVYCFQSWCPACHSHGFPTLKAVREKFANDKDVVFVTVQTVFEGFETNTTERGKATLAKFGLEDLPLAQSGSPKKRSSFMKSYRTGGTPWTVIISPDGKVSLDGFRVNTDQAVKLIERLKAEAKKKGPRGKRKSPAKKPAKTDRD